MEKKIAIMAGDGIGPEVMQCCYLVIEAIATKYNHKFEIREVLVGGAAYERYSLHLPEESIEISKNCDAILFGSVGGPSEQNHLPKWKDCERNSILALRQAFKFSINLRPVVVPNALMYLSPLKDDRIGNGLDIMFIRELLGDIYFGDHLRWNEHGKRKAKDTAEYCESQIVPAVEYAFRLASERKQQVCLVHKANVLHISALWRDIGREFSLKYPNIPYQDMLVDRCALELVKNPGQFDIIVTSNLFGDILSDLGAALPGSLGVLASASINSYGFGLYEPAGGSAPDIAGKGIANPIAQILSFALMLKMSFNLATEAEIVEKAVYHTLQQGIYTRDIAPIGKNSISTLDFTKEVVKQILE
jgi:3-isopropylmalate dehydrogenase